MLYENFGGSHMIIDCVLYNGEEVMLRARMEELKDLVDYHIIVECGESFTKRPTPLAFPSIRGAINTEKIIYLPADRFPDDLPGTPTGPRDRERWLRNYPIPVIKERFSADDIILFCDLDEIPRPEAVKDWISVNTFTGKVAMEMDLYYYNLNWRWTTRWYFAYLIKVGDIASDTDLTVLRLSNASHAIPNAGWHLSYFMTVPQIQRKLVNSCHTQYATAYYLNSKRIQAAIDNGVDLFGRANIGLIERVPATTRKPKCSDTVLAAFNGSAAQLMARTIEVI